MPTIDNRIIEALRRQQLVTEYIIYPFSDIENYQIKLTNVPSFSKEDVLVITNKKILPHWVESQGNVWTKITKLIKNTPLKIYTLTGNAGANNASNIGNTFIFSDDFSGDLSKWTVNAGTWTISNGVLSQTSTSNTNNFIYMNVGTENYLVEVDIRPDTWGTQYSPNSYTMGISIRDDATTDKGHGFSININNAAQMAMFQRTVLFEAGVNSITFATGTWYSFKLFAELTTQNKSKGKAWVKNSTEPNWLIDYTASNSLTYKTIGLFAGNAEGSGNSPLASFDNFRVRKYIANEPIVKKVKTLHKSLLLKELLR